MTIPDQGVTLVTLMFGVQSVSTTSLKLPETLKKRVATAAQRRGMTAHAFMIDAIEESAQAAEHRATFVAQAEKARKVALRTGKGYEPDAVHEYLRARLIGRQAARPKSVAWRD
ncbi:MAG: ribbon-helix-helix domain-containing protein [Proteobacteria bacterium]|nr:ribbon-helix-helix domain-containing protein [Pseudomonadota bacterium]